MREEEVAAENAAVERFLAERAGASPHAVAIGGRVAAVRLAAAKRAAERRDAAERAGSRLEAQVETEMAAEAEAAVNKVRHPTRVQRGAGRQSWPTTRWEENKYAYYTFIRRIVR
eukprot:1176761-Prorocentrum_minimum.AAC.9